MTSLTRFVHVRKRCSLQAPRLCQLRGLPSTIFTEKDVLASCLQKKRGNVTRAMMDAMLTCFLSMILIL